MAKQTIDKIQKELGQTISALRMVQQIAKLTGHEFDPKSPEDIKTLLKRFSKIRQVARETRGNMRDVPLGRKILDASRNGTMKNNKEISNVLQSGTKSAASVLVRAGIKMAMAKAAAGPTIQPTTGLAPQPLKSTVQPPPTARPAVQSAAAAKPTHTTTPTLPGDQVQKPNNLDPFGRSLKYEGKDMYSQQMPRPVATTPIQNGIRELVNYNIDPARTLGRASNEATNAFVNTNVDAAKSVGNAAKATGTAGANAGAALVNYNVDAAKSVGNAAKAVDDFKVNMVKAPFQAASNAYNYLTTPKVTSVDDSQGSGNNGWVKAPPKAPAPVATPQPQPQAEPQQPAKGTSGQPPAQISPVAPPKKVDAGAAGGVTPPAKQPAATPPAVAQTLPPAGQPAPVPTGTGQAPIKTGPTGTPGYGAPGAQPQHTTPDNPVATPGGATQAPVNPAPPGGQNAPTPATPEQQKAVAAATPAVQQKMQEINSDENKQKGNEAANHPISQQLGLGDYFKKFFDNPMEYIKDCFSGKEPFNFGKLAPLLICGGGLMGVLGGVTGGTGGGVMGGIGGIALLAGLIGPALSGGGDKGFIPPKPQGDVVGTAATGSGKGQTPVVGTAATGSGKGQTPAITYGGQTFNKASDVVNALSSGTKELADEIGDPSLQLGPEALKWAPNQWEAWAQYAKDKIVKKGFGIGFQEERAAGIKKIDDLLNQAKQGGWFNILPTMA